MQANVRCANFSASYSYDSNGNITALQRRGQTGASAYGLLDNLTMTLNGNQLKSVSDASTLVAYNNGFDFKDGAKLPDEYAYDENGCLTKDLNKGIAEIQYNPLYLPRLVKFADGSTITYAYSCDDAKLRTVHQIAGATTTTDYCGSAIYENGVAKRLLIDAGYASLPDGKYHFYLNDHQGNVRVVADAAGAVKEVNHYYPFGGTFANSTSIQPYKYNGKELDRQKGLNWYDYGARRYDAALGRFTTVDALAEKYHDITPYAYCGNEPMTRIDPDGNDWRVQTKYNRETGKIEYLITINAVLYNNSSNRQLDMKSLASLITTQVQNAYTISTQSTGSMIA